MSAIYADETNLIKSADRFTAARTLERLSPSQVELRARYIARAHGAGQYIQQVVTLARSVFDVGGSAKEALDRARAYAIELATSPGSAA